MCKVFCRVNADGSQGQGFHLAGGIHTSAESCESGEESEIMEHVMSREDVKEMVFTFYSLSLSLPLSLSLSLSLSRCPPLAISPRVHRAH